MTDTNAEVIVFTDEKRRELFRVSQEAAIGYASLATALCTVDNPSGSNAVEVLRGVRTVVRSLFSEDTVDPGFCTDLIGQRHLSRSAQRHAEGALNLLGAAAEYVKDWNQNDPLAGRSVDVYAHGFYQRPQGSTRLEEIDSSRRRRLTMPSVRLEVLMSSELSQPLELVLASDPENIAAVKAEPEKAIPGLNRVFRRYHVAGLALPALWCLDDKKFVPSFTVVSDSWKETDL